MAQTKIVAGVAVVGLAIVGCFGSVDSSSSSSTGNPQGGPAGDEQARPTPPNSSRVPESSSTIAKGQCSKGTPYNASTVFPSRDANRPLPPKECIRRCGDISKARWGTGVVAPQVSALPTGACTTDDESCQMVAVRPQCHQLPADKDSPRGPAYQFACECIEGQWSCEGNYFGGDPNDLAPCTDAGPSPEGGTDAG